jgi:hypothetical protein
MTQWAIRAGILLAALFAFPASAGAAVLYDNTGATNAAWTSTDFPTGMDNLDGQGADDFTVPPGLPWHVTSVETFAGTASDTMGVYVYADGGTIPGAEVFHQTGIPIPVANLQTFPVSGLLLQPGGYWISLQASGAQAWAWSSQTPVRGDQAVYRNNSIPACTTYKPINACGFPTASDFYFRINGDVVAPTSTLPLAKKKKCKKHKKHASAAKKKKCKKKKKQ